MTVARFWRKIPQRYNLIGTKCETCGRHFFPPRTFCPDCRRTGKIVDHKFAGFGTDRHLHGDPDRSPTSSPPPGRMCSPSSSSMRAPR